MTFSEGQLLRLCGVFGVLCRMGIVSTGQACGWVIAAASIVTTVAGAVLWSRERRP